VRALTPDTKRIISLLYVAAALVLIIELSEAAVLIYPPHPGVASWRYGTVGVLAGKVATFALADVMILGAALFLGHRLVLRVAAFLHLLFGLLLLPVIVMYVLDTLVLRRAIRPQLVRGFDLNSLRTVGISLLGSLTGILFFWRIGKARIMSEPVKEGRGVLITDMPAEQ
jgi:hypothetical protein